jgi:hypothetical protein
MITDPASAIKREVLQLIDLAIEMLRRDSSLNSPELLDYKTLSEKTRTLMESQIESVEPGWSSNFREHPKL